MSDLISFAKNSITKGSKSFAFASFFFSENQRAGAWLLYSWCRYCDDQIDSSINPADAASRLQHLREQSIKAINTEDALSHKAFEGLRMVAREFDIPLKYPMDLLRGMQMDVELRKYETLKDLEEYCYCVAGVVGLMMCHVMGISDLKALNHAVALGTAMQLTNISRDVNQDFKMGRIYFPRTWMKEIGLDETNFGFARNRLAWANLTQKLLLVADEKYKEGEEGLQYLSPRAAMSIWIAARVYRGIGVKVLRQGYGAWNQRVYVSHWQKLAIAFQSLRQALTNYLRNRKSWEQIPIKKTWGEA